MFVIVFIIVFVSVFIIVFVSLAYMVFMFRGLFVFAIEVVILLVCVRMFRIEVVLCIRGVRV